MYTFRFPFRLPPGREISAEHVCKKVGDLELSLQKDGLFYVLTAKGSSSEEEAKSFIFNIRSGLAWLLLKHDIATKVDQDNLEPQQIMYAENATDGGSPAVYLTSKSIRTATGGQPALITTTPSQMALDAMAEGLSFSKSDVFVEDPKLSLALDLYGAYFTEQSLKARFLTLMMALEALATRQPRTCLVQTLLMNWRTEIDKLMENLHPDTDDAKSLEALARELDFRSEDSIRRAIQTLVCRTLKGVPGVDVKQLADRAKTLFDKKSRLSHNGTLGLKDDPQALTLDAKNLVHLILMTTSLTYSRFVSWPRRHADT